jgi:hypothetical protein
MSDTLEDVIRSIRESDNSDDSDVCLSDVEEEGPDGPMIKVKLLPPIHHQDEWVFSPGSQFGAVVGPSGCGKTVLIRMLIPKLTSEMCHLVLCTRIEGNPVHEQLRRWCKVKGIKFDSAYTIDAAEKAIEDAINTDSKGHKVILFDDFCNYSSRRDDKFNKLAITAYSVLRNMNCSMIFVTQSYISVPPLVRTNLNTRFVFPACDTQSFRGLKQDLRTIHGREFIDAALEPLFALGRQEPYQFLMFKRDPPTITIGFDREIVPTGH